MKKQSIQDLWIEKHPEMEAAEVALREAAQWDKDPSAFRAKVERAQEELDKVRQKLEEEYAKAQPALPPVQVPSKINAVTPQGGLGVRKKDSW